VGVKAIGCEGTEYECEDWGFLADLPFLNSANWLDKLPEFDIFADCGPGTSYSEAWWVKRDRPNTKVIGFEPMPERFSQLLKDGYPGYLLGIGVSDKIGTVDWFCGEQANLMVAEVEKPHKRKIQGRVVTLDSQFRDMEGSLFVWADIEGAAMFMLRGATELLKSQRIVGLNIELWSFRYGDDWGSYKDDVIAHLGQYGYHPKYVMEGLAHNIGDVIFLNEQEK
jgi:FkbM family methyltransferase